MLGEEERSTPGEERERHGHTWDINWRGLRSWIK